jgi:hypothetical protein
MVFLIVLLLVILLAGFWGWRTLQDFRAFKTHLNSLENLATGDLAQLDLQGAAWEVEELRSNMLALHRDAGPFLWLTPYLGWVPGFGSDILAAQDLMTIGLNLTEAGDLLLEAFSPVVEAGMESPELRQLATSSLMEAQPQLEQAQILIADAVQARAGIEIESLSEQLQGYLIKLDRYLPMAELGLYASQVAGDLLGLHDPRAYLVVAQNNDELRATGGFITAAGRVVLQEGKIAEMSFMDSYAVDDFSNYYPDPPQALYDTMLAEQWLFRDSNWSPDFPTAAQQMATFFEMGTGQTVDGVIAMDMVGLRILVDAMGPLSIAGEGAPLTGAEVVEWMRSTRGGLEEGEALGEWWLHRKDFMGPLADAIKNRLESGQVDWIQLIKAARQVVREKHLLVYFEDVDTQTLLRAQNLDGALKPTQSDYWMIVDSNVGINKADANIEREILYQISMAQDGSLLANLEIHYRNRTPAGDEPCDPNPRYSEIYQGETQRCYWDYLRVYVPQMAELLQMPSAPLPEISLPGEKLNRGGEETFQVLESEAGKQVFSLYFLLPRGEEQKWSFSYRLPPDTLQNENGRWHYRLDIQKQPGKRTEQVQVILVLPGVSEIFYVDPQPRDVLSDEVRFSFGLETDLVLQLEFQVNE